MAAPQPTAYEGTAYDEFTLALHALRGLDCLVSGAGNVIQPGEFGPLLSLVVDRFETVHELIKKQCA